MSYLSLTSWSLHRSLGPLRMTEWDENAKQQVVREVPQPQNTDLLGLPAIASTKGIQALDVCHFHFPGTSPEYLRQLRQAFSEAHVTFFTLLVDYGDISSKDEARRSSDISYIENWVDIASSVGAERVRVVGGESLPSDTEGLNRAAEGLKHLIQYAEQKNVRIITENFRSLTSTAENCVYLRNTCGDDLGLICDFGNFRSSQKYDDLAKILPYAESIHAKAHYDSDGFPDVEEFQRCLDLLPIAKYDGPITLVFDGAGDEWAGIERIKKVVESYL